MTGVLGQGDLVFIRGGPDSVSPVGDTHRGGGVAAVLTRFDPFRVLTVSMTRERTGTPCGEAFGHHALSRRRRLWHHRPPGTTDSRRRSRRTMRRPAPTLACLALCLALPAGHAAADVLVDQGPPDYVYALASTPHYSSGLQFEADDFTLKSAAGLGGLTFWGTYFVGNTPFPDDFRLYVYQDAGGLPGAVIDQQALAVTRTDTGRRLSMTGGEVYQYTAALAAVPLSAGSYWLGIVNDAGSRTDYWGWATHDQTGKHAVSTADPVTGPWKPRTSADFAFQLTSTAAVPEPSTLALAGLGLAAVVLWGRPGQRASTGA